VHRRHHIKGNDPEKKSITGQQIPPDSAYQELGPVAAPTSDFSAIPRAGLFHGAGRRS